MNTLTKQILVACLITGIAVALNYEGLVTPGSNGTWNVRNPSVTDDGVSDLTFTQDPDSSNPTTHESSDDPLVIPDINGDLRADYSQGGDSHYEYVGPDDFDNPFE